MENSNGTTSETAKQKNLVEGLEKATQKSTAAPINVRQIGQLELVQNGMDDEYSKTSLIPIREKQSPSQAVVLSERLSF